MGPEQGFIQSIIENPDDDAVRLIFADWLEERDDPRGEFIRIQVKRDRPGLDEARETKLLGAHEKEWVAPLRPWVREWRFVRGFVEWVRVPAEYILGEGRKVFRLTPVRDARFNEATEHITRLAAVPELARLRSLDLGYNLLALEQVNRLATSPHLAGLDSLNLACNPLNNDGAVALSHASLPRLRELYLYRTQLGVAGLDALLQAPGRPGFTVLDLHSNPLHAEGAGVLARSASAASLVSLDLSDTHSHDGGARALAASRHLGNLKYLRLGHSRLTAAGAAALARARSLEALEELDLSGNDIGDTGALALARSTALRRLRRLHLRFNRVDGVHARRVLRERFGDGVSC
ncbi:MAG TPA: TIGR02996 domain-containing protein [Gemmataceae bacterium]|nr:TIGR02996 domain-containing protein [Gemmataceae bacterium]